MNSDSSEEGASSNPEGGWGGVSDSVEIDEAAAAAIPAAARPAARVSAGGILAMTAAW